MARPEAPASQLDLLTSINIDDMLESFGLTRLRRGRQVLTWLCRPAARDFARQVVAYDAAVAAGGLRGGAELVLQTHVHQVEVAGQAHVPASGPVLVVANHPGLTDTMALFLSLPRHDLRILAADRPFLRTLPNTCQHLIFASEQSHQRLTALRSVLAHFRAGGAILTFPGGRIEPDPAVLPGAVAALDRWSESVGLLARLAPAIQIVPAIVSGVLSAPAQAHPLTRLRREREARERFGAMLQIIVPAYRAVTVRVAYGPPLLAADLLAACSDPAAITHLVASHARRLIEEPPTDWRALLAPAVGPAQTRRASRSI